MYYFYIIRMRLFLFDAFSSTFNSNLVQWTTKPNKNKIDKLVFVVDVKLINEQNYINVFFLFAFSFDVE